MHRVRRLITSTEANLSSHLSISYSAVPTASGTSVAAATGTAAPKTEGAAGFLAALVDQLLAGAAGGTPSAPDLSATADPTAAATSAPALPFGVGLDPAAAAAAQATPKGNVLLAQLTGQLKTLQDQLDAGQTPDPDLLKKIGDTADAIAAMIAPPSAAATPSIDPEAILDPLAATGQSPDKRKSDPVAGLDDKAGAQAAPQPAVNDQVAQFLASLGLSLAPASPATDPAASTAVQTDASVSPTSSATPLPAIAQLASRLAALGDAVAPAAPELAQKLEALSRKLDAAESSPQALAQLTSAGDSDGSELDRVVRSLLGGKAATGTAIPVQTSTRTQPEAPAPAAPQSDAAQVEAPPAPLTTAPVATPSITAKVASTGGAASDAGAGKDGDETIKPEARIVAAATAKTDTKSDTPETSPQPLTATAAPQATTAAPRAVAAAYQAASNPINMGQVAFEMVRQVHQGQSRFSIRLDPPELGRVDVKMHVDASGTVNARLTVERSETLDMFQRDRGALEKALSQAGLDTGKTNLEFSLKQNPFAGLTGGDQRPGQGQQGGSPRFSVTAADADDGAMAVPSVTLYRGVASAGGVNLFV